MVPHHFSYTHMAIQLLYYSELQEFSRSELPLDIIWNMRSLLDELAGERKISVAPLSFSALNRLTASDVEKSDTNPDPIPGIAF